MKEIKIFLKKEKKISRSGLSTASWSRVHWGRQSATLAF